MAQFRSAGWDPVMILSQILAVQCLFYVTLGGWVLMTDYITASSRSLDQLFDYETLQVHPLYGRLPLVAYILNALTSAVTLWYVVKRTKQCLDFAATTYLLHLVACSGHSGRFPSTPSWWITNLVALTIQTLVGEALCMHSEMRAIPLSAGLGAKAVL